MQDLSNNIKLMQSIAPAVLDADANGTGVDTQGYENVAIVVDSGVEGITLSGTNKIEFELEHSNSFYSAVFCGSVSGYNFVKYFGLTKFYYRSLTTRLKYIQLVSFLSFMGFVVVFFQLHQNY